MARAISDERLVHALTSRVGTGDANPAGPRAAALFQRHVEMEMGKAHQERERERERQGIGTNEVGRALFFLSCDDGRVIASSKRFRKRL